MGKVTNGQVFSNLFWRLLERFGAHGVTLVVSIVLARLLDPTAYGTIAIITVFTSILGVFLDGGFSSALIQKKDCDDVDFSTVFYFQLTFSGLLYLIMFIASPFISDFYQMRELTPLIRVMSLGIIVSAVKSVQSAYVSRKLMFKKFFFSTLGGTIAAAILGIWMAYHGFGAWALVMQGLVNSIIDTIILWITVPWRPILAFSFMRLKQLFSFGSKLLISNLIDTVYNNLRSLVIGKVYTSQDLAFYNKGQVFPNLIVTNVNSSINSVLFPVMSSAQEDTETVKRMTRRAIKTSTCIMFPLMIGLAVCAEPLVRLLLTEKWLPCVLYLRIFCFTYAFYPIHTANLNAVQALGRSDIFLKLEVIKKAIGFLAIFITVFISVEALAYSLIVTSILSQIINAWPNRKILKYGYHEQLKDMLPSMLVAVCMSICVYPIQLVKIPDIVVLILSVFVGALIYIALSYLLKVESFHYLLQFMTASRKKNNKN